MKNCTLVGLTDLDQSLAHTQDRIIDYLNRLIDMGVSGFRFDASKHMWPAVSGDGGGMERRVRELGEQPEDAKERDS